MLSKHADGDALPICKAILGGQRTPRP